MIYVKLACLFKTKRKTSFCVIAHFLKSLWLYEIGIYVLWVKTVECQKFYKITSKNTFFQNTKQKKVLQFYNLLVYGSSYAVI